MSTHFPFSAVPARDPGKVLNMVLLMPLLFLAAEILAQSRTVIQTKEEYWLFERDARLGLTKALVENDRDSIRYWRDMEVEEEWRRNPRRSRLVDDRSRTLLNFYLGDVRGLLNDIEHESHYFNSSEEEILGHVVRYSFQDAWALWSDFILDQIDTAAISNYEKDLLTVYWMSALTDLHAYSFGIGYSQNDINARANALLEAAPDHRMAPFIRDHIRQEYEESYVELGNSFGAGAALFTDELVPLIDPGFLIHVGIEVFRSRLQIFSAIDWRRAPAASQFLMDTLALEPGDRISWNTFSLGGGIVLLDGHAGRMIISVGAQAFWISSPIQDTTYSSGFFFQPLGTLTFDVKFGRSRTSATGWRGTMSDWPYARTEVSAVRLLLGYTPGSLAPHMQYQGGMFSATIGIAFHGRRPVRIP